MHIKSEIDRSSLHQLIPERQLVAAVLKRAILDYTSGNKAESKDAEKWIFADSNSLDMEFSFAWICEHLDINFELLLGKLRNLDESTKNKG